MPHPIHGKRWRLKPTPDDLIVQALTHDRCPAATAAILAQRGIRDPQSARALFRPRLEDLHDPFLMADMRNAVERIERALGDNEHIMIYGDYDVDGTTAVALVHSFLARYASRISHYIPDRYTEGYGISYKGIDHAQREGVSLIIALDCGIKAIDKVTYATERGIDFIICDHHRPGDTLPAAVAVLDPKRHDCPYPYKELSGCGIGFKLVQALAQRNGIDFQELIPLLDLVAVSTACDIVALTGENRILAHHGIAQLNTDPRPGIRAMMGMANVRKRLSISDLVFTIGPRINAAGRIAHGRQAVELLMAHDIGEAEQIGRHVDLNNHQRQELDKTITQQALDAIGDVQDTERCSTVVFDPTWHKGVIGIVASRLIEHHYRPTVVLTQSNGTAVGSARSVKGFDVYEAISACHDLLEQFGGHMYAAGLTMPLANVAAFQERFEQVVRETIRPEQRVPEEEVDIEITLDQITPALVRVLHHLAPYGPGNMRPVFLSRGLQLVGTPRLVGENHLKMTLSQSGTDLRFDAIAFRQAHHMDLVRSGEPFSMLYVIEENEWNGRTTVQLNVKDIRAGVDQLLVHEQLHSSLA